MVRDIVLCTSAYLLKEKTWQTVAKDILWCAVQCLVFGQLKLTIDKTWQAASVILQCAVR